MENSNRPFPATSSSDLFVGTLSGTSVNGIDAALVRFTPQPALVAKHTVVFPPELKKELLALGSPVENEIDRLGRADVSVGRLFGRAVNELLSKAKVTSAEICAIGSHGQTIRHRPRFNPPFTLQIGDPNVIAAETGIPVVADFRRKDMALGGQGAPLAPAFHEAVFRRTDKDRVVVNIGGIANITALPADPTRPILGFDTGPGNTLLDAWSRRVMNTPMDFNGAFAARGLLVPELLQAFLADPYFARPAPKSTGPEQFSKEWLQQHLSALPKPERDADVQATLVALTVRSIADAIKALPGLTRPDIFVCGGSHNATLMLALHEQLLDCVLDVTDVAGVPADWVEALAFAWLARQRVLGLPGNCPQVTGARHAAVLGGVYLPG